MDWGRGTTWFELSGCLKIKDLKYVGQLTKVKEEGLGVE